jgi:hypothetical protein
LDQVFELWNVWVRRFLSLQGLDKIFDAEEEPRS